jgi:S1-C subfamily serine protease
MGVVEELEQLVRDGTEAVGPAVVAIGRGARGSGVVVAEGRVLTNAHNLRDRSTTVTFGDGRVEQGTAAGVDVDGDLAVLTVDTTGAPPVAWADPAAGVAPGAVVLAASRGRRGLRVTFGLVTGVEAAFRGPRGRRITGSIEHTAPLARGASGGPLLDRSGRLLGVNTNRLGEGFYLALPADEELRARVDALAAGTSMTRPTLGLGLAPPHVARRLRRSVGLPDRDGLLVRSVAEGGPAATADLRQGDLLVAAGDRALASADDLYDVLDALEPGSELDLTVVRGVEELTVTVAFPAEGDAEAPDA